MVTKEIRIEVRCFPCRSPSSLMMYIAGGYGLIAKYVFECAEKNVDVVDVVKFFNSLFCSMIEAATKSQVSRYWMAQSIHLFCHM